MIAVVDNDIIFKGSCYSFLTALCQAVGGQTTDLGTLSAAPFVVERRIRRAGIAGDVNAAVQSLRSFMDEATALDPTIDEQNLAAELEYAAQLLALPLDVGESLLCSITAIRGIPWMLTGDKRAIEALEGMLGTQPDVAGISGKVRCLEQLVLALVEQLGIPAIREKVCAERVDMALTLSFSCFQPDAQPQSVLDGLNSYIGDLRKKAPHILAP
jgi:hypothetical protein